MKKILVVVGLLAFCSISAFAASVKTSKAIALSDTQMESVKGQGTLTVYWWNGSGYQVVATYDTGSFDHNNRTQYTGGPLDGQHFTYPY